MKINRKIKKEAKSSNQNPSADTMYNRITSKKKSGKSPQDDGESTLRKLELDDDETVNADQRDKSDIYLKQIYDIMSQDREKKLGLDKWSKKGKKG